MPPYRPYGYYIDTSSYIDNSTSIVSNGGVTQIVRRNNGGMTVTTTTSGMSQSVIMNHNGMTIRNNDSKTIIMNRNGITVNGQPVNTPSYIQNVSIDSNGISVNGNRIEPARVTQLETLRDVRRNDSPVAVQSPRNASDRVAAGVAERTVPTLRMIPRARGAASQPQPANQPKKEE